MATLAYIIPVCWAFALLATPRKPRRGNEVEELVYARLLGRQQRLVGVAAIVTAVTVLGLILTLPQRIDPTLAVNRQLKAYCAADASRCYHLEPDGRWLEAARQSAGQWVVVGTVAAPAFSAVCATLGSSVEEPPADSLAFRCSWRRVTTHRPAAIRVAVMRSMRLSRMRSTSALSIAVSFKGVRKARRERIEAGRD